MIARQRRLAKRKFRQFQQKLARRRNANAPIEPSQLELESLEPRVLLTTLVGGDIFDYIDAAGQHVRVQVDGDIIAELIGADLDENNNVIVGDVSGVFVSSDIGRTGAEVGGGLGGEGGIENIGGTSITDAVIPGNSFGFTPAGSAQINFQALASDSAGNTYGFNVATVDEAQVVQLVQFDTSTGEGTVIADLSAALSTTQGILAADFNTDDSLLYFVAAVGEGEVDTLYTIDLSSGVRATIEGSLDNAGTITSAEGQEVRSLAFEHDGVDENLYAFIGGEDLARIVTLDTPAPGVVNTTFITNVNFGDEAASGITGIEFVNEDPSSGESFIYATDTAGDNDQLLRIDLDNGQAFSLGGLADPDDATEPTRGAGISGLTWNDSLINPFTGELGVLLATDSASDELVALDHRPRFPEADLFAIYVSQGDPDGSISVSIMTGDPLILDPFGDGQRSVRVNPAGAGDLIVVGQPVGSGGAYLGAQTEDVSEAEDEDLIPILTAAIDTTIGVRPIGLGSELSAGLTVGESLLDFVNNGSWSQRLMGQNFDNVSELSMSLDGTRLIAIDIDSVDESGITLGGDQLTRIDPTTGRAAVPVNVTTASAGAGILIGDPLSNIQGLDWGDPDFDGTETLFAIYDLVDLDGDTFADPTLGTIDPDTGEFTAIGVIDNGGDPISEVQAMAFDVASGVIYVIDSDNNIHQIDPSDGSVTASATVEDGDGNAVNITSMDFVDPTRLMGQDKDNGRLVDIDLTGFAGGTVVVGENVATTTGSLRPTVGAITYDVAGNRFLAADNATGILPTGSEGGFFDDSSVLMELVGFDSDSAEAQDLGQFLFGGTVTGKVDISGSVDTFYAGWLLTGDTTGESASTISVQDNFSVGGDLRDLIVFGPMGGDGGGTVDEPNYVTGLDIQVGGLLGQIRTFDRFHGNVDVENDVLADGYTYQSRPQTEYEAHNPGGQRPVATAWSNFELYSLDGRFENDSFDTAQRLGSVRDAAGGDHQIVVQGEIQQSTNVNDPVDYYAVSLMAGQTITVQLLPRGLSSSMNVGVFDPDGRLIATDHSNVDPSSVNGEAFTFTADRPGEYRFAVAFSDDTEFNGSVVELGSADYELRISNAGEIALGAIVADADIYSSAFSVQDDLGDFTFGVPAINVQRGDIGALTAGGGIASSGSSPAITAATGNLRSMQGATIGETSGGLFSFGPEIEIAGSIGLIQSTAGVADVNATIGGDLQVVDAAGTLFIDLTADGGVGVIRAGDMATENVASRIEVNADNIGQDGIIDLIDVEGDFGSIAPGGPQITTNEGGNVRYIRVGGEVFQDTAFGGGDPTTTIHDGSDVTFIDDGGGKITLRPETFGRNPNFDPDDPESGPEFVATNMEITTYGIRGSGGVVLVDVTADGEFSVTSKGSGGQPVEISEININNSTGKTFVERNGKLFLSKPGDNLDLTFNGNVAIDVFSIVAEGTIFNRLINFTEGELVNLIIGGAGELITHGNLGIASQHTDAAVLGSYASTTGSAARALTFPFNDARNAVISGSIVDLISHKGIGDVAITNSTADGGLLSIQRVVANADGNNDVTQFEGINGAILVGGNVNFVDIGEGILPSGSGNLADAGLFVTGDIGSIWNQGRGSDIRGDIAFGGTLGKIVLNNGAIINADIIHTNDFGQTREFISEYSSVEQADNFERPSYELGQITLNGSGSGIIGSLFYASDIQGVNIKGGWGLFNSEFSVPGAGAIGNITVSGFGILDTVFNGGSKQGNIAATGNGQLLSVSDFGSSVRLSETETTDPFFGFAPNRLTDLHEFLGTDPSNPGVSDTETSGLISGVDAQGSRSLGMVTAYQIFDSSFDFANTIRGFKTTDIIDTLQITTGNLGQFNPGDDVFALDLVVSGQIKNIRIKGDLADDSSISAIGPNGVINVLRVDGDVEGDILAAASIKKLDIRGDLDGSITVLNGDNRGVGLYNMRLGGSLGEGSLDINGDVKRIEVLGSLGDPGSLDVEDTLLIRGDLGQLLVGTDRQTDNSALALDVVVLGDLGKLQVQGRVTGDILVSGDAKNIIITADNATEGTAIVHNAAEDIAINVGGQLTKFQVVNGDIGDGAGNTVDITAGNGIRAFDLRNGDVAADATVAASFGDITNFTIRGGDLLGDVRAANGTIGKLDVRGSDVAGTITARDLNRFQIDGSLLNGSAIIVDQHIGQLVIREDIEAGASVTAGSASKLQVGNDMAGTIAVGDTEGRIVTTINNDLTGDLTLGGESQITIKGDVASDSTIQINDDLKQLNVNGNMAGGVIVTGAADKVILGSMVGGAFDGAALAVGLDLNQLNVRGDIQASLVQVGISAGEDGAFGTADSGETSRMGNLNKLNADNVIDSIIAAGGTIGNAVISDDVSDSSISAGLSVGGTTVADVLDGTLDLTAEVDRNTARGNADRTLFRGDINRFQADNLIDADITAGVDAGDDGDFDSAAGDGVNVITSVTGGHSVISRIDIRNSADADSFVLTDSGINRENISNNAATVDQVDYVVGDLTPNNPLEALADTADKDNTVTVNGITVTITGNVSVEVRDDSGTLGRIDTLVITGNDPRATITVTGGGEIGRVITADDVQFDDFIYDGDLVGDGSDDVDLWLDTDNRLDTVQFESMGDPDDLVAAAEWTGQIGGNVNRLIIDSQGSGSLYVGGVVNNLILTGSFGEAAVASTAETPTNNITQMTASAAGNVWVFDEGTGQLSEVDVNNDNTTLTGPIDVFDVLDPGTALNLLGLDFDNATGDLLGVADLLDLNPTQQVTALADGFNLVGAATDSNGVIYAIDSSLDVDNADADDDTATGTDDRLVTINPVTGAVTQVGLLRDLFGHTYSGNILSLAFDADNNLYALIDDQDGTFGTTTTADGVVLARLEQTGVNDAQGNQTIRVRAADGSASVATFLDDAGAVTSGFNGMAIDSDGNIYAVRDTGGQNTIVQIAEDGTVTTIGNIQVSGAATNISGIGFDANDNLFALDITGGVAQVLRVDLVDPVNDTVVVGEPGVISSDVDGFTVDRSGANPVTYAYDFNNPGNNQLLASTGVATPVLGTIDTGTGEFTRLQTLLDADGLLDADILSITVDNDNTGNAFVLTDDGRLIEYTTAGDLVGEVGTIVDANNQTLDITAIDFDDATGDLVGIDARFNRLVTIDPLTGQATPRQEAGLIDASVLNTLAFDASTGELRSVRDNTTDEFVTFTSLDPDEFGRITANSYNQVNITGPYDGRLASTGNTFNKVVVTGDFAGRLSTVGSVNQFDLRDGDFAGSLIVGGDVGKFQIRNGDFASTGVLEVAGELKQANIQSGQTGDGNFAGLIDAASIGKRLDIQGDGAATGQIVTSHEANQVLIRGDYAGSMQLAGVRNLTVNGDLESAADLTIDGTTGNMTIKGDVDAGSTIVGLGEVNKLTVNGTHSGAIALREGAGQARFNDIDEGFVSIAQDTNKVDVRGDLTEAILSFGTWVGDDGIYNTADDVIIGGTVSRVSVRGDVADSAIVAGVLPDISFGPGVPSTLTAYTGNSNLFGALRDDLAAVDGAEAGGLLPSDINRVDVRGRVFTSGVGATQDSVIAAAGEIGRIGGRDADLFETREYGDPYGGPQVISIDAVSATEFRVVFNEEIDTSSLVLSHDANNDGDLNDALDTLGSITIVTGAGILDTDDGVKIGYTTTTDDSGNVQGVLRVVKADGFGDAPLNIELSGDLSDPAVLDRSGLRSALRDFNQDGVEETGEDVFGTILDGDADGEEGGNPSTIIVLQDSPDAFDDALDGDALALATDAGTIDIASSFLAGGDDVDIYKFTATAFEFLAAQFSSTVDASLAVFFQDDQGTVSTVDDTFEMLSRVETSDLAGEIFQATELSKTGTYFVAVTGGSDTEVSYTLELTRSSTDQALVTALGGSVPVDEQIAYVSDEIGDHNNLLGANVSKQLVYLDFDGGTSIKTSQGVVDISAFDWRVFDASMNDNELVDAANLNDALLNGDVTAGVVGILDNLVSIFTDIPANAGSLDVQMLGADLTAFSAANLGLFFTTVDPTLSGFDADADFTTIFTGETDAGWTGLMGIANQVDELNMSKADEAIIFAESFEGMSSESSTVDRLNDYSTALANIIAHELGHTLGLQHHPTTFDDYDLVADDPNNDGDASDANTGISVMAYSSNADLLDVLHQFGTMNVSSNEFPVGDVDHIDQLLLTLA